MIRSSYHIFSIIFLLAFLSQCANPIAPTGGPRDEVPPIVIKEESTPNFQTNFEKQEIILTFNEWVVLKDVFNQVVVSPPLASGPEVNIKKKSVIFEFDEEEQLREEATYTINFGDAIQDLTEGNPALDNRFVFSTGDFIDSLVVNGSIEDALTGEPVEDVIFALYDNLADSVVRTERPFYFGKTNKAGRFKVENIKSDTFKVFALKDANRDLKFNQASEAIAFLDSFLVLPQDSLSIQLRLFTEEPPLRLESFFNDRYGLLKLSLNKEVPKTGVQITSNDGEADFIREYDKDTLKLWYNSLADTSSVAYVRYDTIINDTVRISQQTREAFLENAQLRYDPASAQRPRRTINPAKPIEVIFRHPLANFTDSLVRVYADTTKRQIFPTISIDTALSRRALLIYPWQASVEYQLEVLPGAFEDIYGLTNPDTLSQTYLGGAAKDYGAILINLSELDSTEQYVVQLLLNGKDLIQEFVVSDKKSESITVKSLQPGKYEVHVITDKNRNSRWDTGSYDLGRQPEPYLRETVKQLRANWEVESNISLDPSAMPPAKSAPSEEN